MGLRALFQNAARTAFKVAGDIPVMCVYRQDKSDDLEQIEPVEFSVQVLFGRIDWRMVTESKDVLPGDVTAIIRVSEMKVRPERGDTITTLTGDRYRVVDFVDGMGDILVNLHVRRL